MTAYMPLFGYNTICINAHTHQFQFNFREFDVTLVTSLNGQGVVQSFTLEARNQWGGYKTNYSVRNGIIKTGKYKIVTSEATQSIEHDLFNNYEYLEHMLGLCINKYSHIMKK